MYLYRNHRVMEKRKIHKLKNVVVSSLINALFVVLCGSVIFKKERERYRPEEDHIC